VCEGSELGTQSRNLCPQVRDDGVGGRRPMRQRHWSSVHLQGSCTAGILLQQQQLLLLQEKGVLVLGSDVDRAP
jgi:hypothetical protein